MASIKATWTNVIDANDIRRSSQIITVTDKDLLVFGGEIKPRQPVDNKLYCIPLNRTGAEQEGPNVLEPSFAPSPRVGSASATIHGRTYIYSGRGGEEMTPVEENGAIHVLDISKAEWSIVYPANSTASFPPARSYHAMAADSVGKLYLHAGCPEKGRLSDLWAFDIAKREWKQLAEAPGPARGGTSIAFLNSKIYRMNGFDGTNEQGFSLEIYDVKTNQWTSRTWGTDSGPSPRSVSTLLALQVGGKDLLVTMFGECDPSTLGHQGAGKMLGDVWAYDVAEDAWKQVEGAGKKPQSRGWFAADTLREKNAIVVHGGLAEDNTRIGDVWTLAF